MVLIGIDDDRRSIDPSIDALARPSHVVDPLSRARDETNEGPNEPDARLVSRLVSTGTGRPTSIAMVAVGDRFPAVIAQSHEPSWPTPVKMQDRLKGKKTLVVGLPGAFTPT